MDFTLSSSAFTNGMLIPVQHTCDGDNRSPDLEWLNPPAQTGSYALILHDPDAPRGDFTHWVLFDIPYRTRSIPEGTVNGTLGILGVNDFGHIGYGGPCPPAGGGPHRYVFTLLALRPDSLGLNRGANRSEVELAMEGRILGRATLSGVYVRK